MSPLPASAAALLDTTALGERFETELSRYLTAAAGDPIPNLHDGMTYALGADLTDPAQRGKRIRPVLCLVSAQALGAPIEAALPFALAIELMHNFALVHDDMEDGDIMRRGRDAAWIRFGVPHAINIGDYLLVHTTRVLTDWGSESLDAATRFRLIRLIGAALDHTHIGQALDMNARGQRHFSEAEYLRIVREKTGYYLAAPIQGGALVGGADDATLEAIGEMAMFLGPLFQIMDDIIDLTHGKGRETIGSDIREGKRSFLVAHAAEHASEAQYARLFDVLDTPRGQTSPDQVEEVLTLFKAHGSIEAGREYCRGLYEHAREKLNILPVALSSALEPILAKLVDRTV